MKGKFAHIKVSKVYNHDCRYDNFFRISFEGFAWVRLVYGGGDWSVWTTVNATKRQDTGKINSSPVTSTAPVVRVQQNCNRVIDIRGKSIFFIINRYWRIGFFIL